ncbi:MAG: hypothetical protein R3B92_02605 [Patescibacteria group bacterium]
MKKILPILIAVVLLGAGVYFVPSLTPNNKVPVDLQELGQLFTSETPSLKDIPSDFVSVANLTLDDSKKLTLTKEKLEELLHDNVVGLEYAGYKVKNASVNLSANLATFTIDLDSDESFAASFKVDSTSKFLELESVKSVGTKKISGLKMTALELALSNVEDLINTYDSKLLAHIQKIAITSDHIEVWLE